MKWHDDLQRLGGSIDPSLDDGTPYSHVKWPWGWFKNDLDYARSRFPSEDLDEDDVTTRVQLDFQKLDEDLEELFPGLDLKRFHPFAQDWAFYFFIDVQSADRDDPMVFSIDHEEMDEEPFERQPLSRFLAYLVVE